MPTPTDSRETACVIPPGNARTYAPQDDTAIVLRWEPSGPETFARWTVVSSFRGASVMVRAFRWLKVEQIPGRKYQIVDACGYALLTGRFW
jgi:hypothetical protein